MLVRGRARVGLREVFAARHQGEGLPPWSSSSGANRALRAGVALAGVGGVTLALMLGLGGGGPVLSGLPGAGPVQDRAPQADVLASSALEAKALEGRQSALGQGGRDMPEGLTLRPGQGDGADAPGPRVSLLPLADQGPAMRGEVTAAKPVQPVSVKDSDGAEARSLARPAADLEPEPPKVKARLIDANADKPLERGVTLSLARP